MSKAKLYTVLIVAFCITLRAQAQSFSVGFDAMRMASMGDPGSNFYQYACGNWIDRLPDKPEYSKYNQIEILKEKTAREILAIICEPPDGDSLCHDWQLISTFYNMYMDSARINSMGAEPLRPYLQSIEQAAGRPELEEAMARVYRMGTTGLLFSIAISPDDYGSRNNIVSLSQGGLSLQGLKYYNDTTSSCQRIRDAYKVYIRRLFELSGYSEEVSAAKCDQAFGIEQAIAAKSLPPEAIRNSQDKFSHRTRFDSLQVLYPGICWKRYFSALGYSEMEYVNVKTPEQIACASHIFGSESISAIKSYIQLKFIIAASKYLSDDFQRETLNFRKELSGVEQDVPRSQRALADINQHLGMPAGRLFVRKYFPEQYKEMVSQMIRNIMDIFRNRILSTKWLCKETRLKASEKLDSMTVLIGYPSQWRSFDALSIDTSKSLLCNYLNIRIFNFDYRVAQNSMPPDKAEWTVAPQTVNGFYNLESNTITLPAGILQPPFFDPKADIACNYGGIGCVIGHELTHGFDAAGRLHDKDGRLCNWWTDGDNAEFIKRSRRVDEYFSNLEVIPGRHVNGANTLSENIADNGGIKLSFEAMQRAIGGSQAKGRDRFTPQQRFFLHYAFVMGGKMRDKEADHSINSDEHSPMELRVNGQLPHQDAWYDAFGIGDDAPMYVPKNERFDIW